MVPPVDQVVAGDVRPAMTLFRLHDIHQMIAALPEQASVGIKRSVHPLGRYDVVGRAIGILQEPVS